LSLLSCFASCYRFEDYVGQLATAAAIAYETGGDVGGDAKPIIKELNKVCHALYIKRHIIVDLFSKCLCSEATQIVMLNIHGSA
jgi:hypothetical protein